jgi:Flp pilus assembly protein TadG
MKRRGTVLLEFMLILPFFLFLILFTVDMGRLVLVSGALSDATYVGTRAVAQYGFIGDVAQDQGGAAFNEAIEAYNLFGDSPSDTVTFTIDNTNGCRTGGSGATAYVEATGTAAIRFITPGLGALLGAVGGGGSSDGNFEVTEQAVLRCEITRS